MYIEDQNAPPRHASADHNVALYQNVTFMVAKMIMKPIVFTNPHCQAISDNMYFLVEEAWILAIEAEDDERSLADAWVGIPAMCSLPGGLFLLIDLQTLDAVSIGFCLIFLCQIYNVYYAQQLT